MGSLAILVVVMALPGRASSQTQETLYAEIQPGVGVSAELGGAGGFLELVTYSLYFFSDSSTFTDDVITAPDSSTSRSILVIGTEDPAFAAVVERCQLADGMPV